MAVPVIEGFQATSGGAPDTDTLTLVAPSGITAGELLLLIACSDDTTYTPQFSDNVSGWTFIGQAGDTGVGAHIGAWYKIAAGGEGNVAVVAESSDQMLGWYIRISGVDTDNPINASQFEQQSDATDHDIAAITTNVADCLAIYGLSFDGGDSGGFSQPTGWTEQDEEATGTGGTNGSGVWGSKTQSSAGSTNTATVTTTASDGSAQFQIAIAPGGGGGSLSVGVSVPELTIVLGAETPQLANTRNVSILIGELTQKWTIKDPILATQRSQDVRVSELTMKFAIKRPSIFTNVAAAGSRWARSIVRRVIASRRF